MPARKKLPPLLFWEGDYQLLDRNLLLSGYDSNASEEELEIQSRCMQPGAFVWTTSAFQMNRRQAYSLWGMKHDGCNRNRGFGRS